MFYFDIKNLESNLSQNFTISKKIEIDKDLDCFIIIDSKNQKILSPVLNRIVDLLLDNIKINDAYWKFSITLESINFFIKNLKTKENNIEDLNIIIWVLEKWKFHFSKIWNTNCYLINNENDIVEISDPQNDNYTFDYISSWKMLSWNKILLSNVDILKNITKSDIAEIARIENPNEINKNLINILNEEKLEQNAVIISIKYENLSDIKENKTKLGDFKNVAYKALDNNLAKKSYALIMILKDYIEKKWKIMKNIIFIFWIILSSIFLYYSIAWIVWETVKNTKVVDYKNELITARDYIRLATENISNPEFFDLNIKKAEDIIAKVEQEKLFLADVENLKNDLSIIKKEFNWIEIFETNSNNLIFRKEFKDWVKILENNKKLYVLAKTSIYWPIVSGKDLKNITFDELEADDEFIDWAVSGDDIIIVTKKSRIVKLNKNWKFWYISVIGQDTWQSSSFIESFNWNIYISNKTSDQIYKHSPSLWSYTSWVWYLKTEDIQNIWKILSIWIDGWIYILNNELKLFKLFVNPKYRLESIVLNKLPKNYNLEGKSAKVIVKQNLNFVYMYLNEKIWVFEPNTKNITDIKSLKYIWQIEWRNEKINWIYVVRDWEIDILTKTWIYKITFEVNKDWKLIVR